jgi:hypothetical protein
VLRTLCDGAVHARGQPKVIRVNDQPSQAPSLPAGPCGAGALAGVGLQEQEAGWRLQTNPEETKRARSVLGFSHRFPRSRWQNRKTA